MSTGREKRRVGELRPSQVLTTFGIGSIVDLPNLSVMVMGLEDWPTPTTGRSPRSGSWRPSAGRSGHRSMPCGRRRSSPTRIGRTRSTSSPASASRSPRSPAGWSAPAVGGWPRSAAACSS